VWYLRRVTDDCMTPALKCGQTVVISMNRSFSEGDIVVAYMDKKEVIKRITDIKDGKVYLENDNKTESVDDSTHGWLIDRHIIGKIIFPRNR